MNAAILCPGPSLSKWAGGEYALTIGVNRAARLHPVDVWAFIDWRNFTDPERAVIGYTPRIVTTRESRRSIEKRGMLGGLSQHRPEMVDELATDCPRALGWTVYTKPVAMVYAHLQGATSIDLWGDDMTDAPDADGHTDESNRRDADRWKREGEIVQAVTGWLADHGCTVRRRF